MWRHIDVQAKWRNLTYGRTPNAIDISARPSTDTGLTFFKRVFRETSLFSRRLVSEDTLSTYSHGGCNVKQPLHSLIQDSHISV